MTSKKFAAGLACAGIALTALTACSEDAGESTEASCERIQEGLDQLEGSVTLTPGGTGSDNIQENTAELEEFVNEWKSIQEDTADEELANHMAAITPMYEAMMDFSKGDISEDEAMDAITGLAEDGKIIEANEYLEAEPCGIE
ncbi:MAG: hypothetical protein ACTHW1_00360 [Ancrocorticia sp.]|uniref:hypothetical protein n=1 Tax=Ancrocorticia sp. TaxID=2593684 RepID=UPI003F8F49BF